MTNLGGLMSGTSLAFVGTGTFGSPMAACLLQAGFTLTVTDKRREAAESLLANGALWADSAAQAAAAADIVFTCLPSQAAIEEVYFGPAGILAMRKPRCVVDLSTSGPEAAERIASSLSAAGVAFVDAPVTGGLALAKEGSLTVIASGAPAAIEQARSALNAIGSRLFIVGPTPGQAQKVKLINNMLNYTALAATSEAVVLGAKAGIEPGLLIQVINAGSGRNSATESKFPTAVLPRSFNYGASHQIVYKDLSLVLALADNLKVPTPIASHVFQLWRTWMRDHGDEDFTTIVKMFEDWSGVQLGVNDSDNKCLSKDIGVQSDDT